MRPAPLAQRPADAIARRALAAGSSRASLPEFAPGRALATGLGQAPSAAGTGQRERLTEP